MPNRTNKQKIGDIGEGVAENYLKKNGYKIIRKNFWQPYGELDLIAIAPDKTLVIFEVKTLHNKNSRQSSDELSPEENLTAVKLKKLQRTASVYANNNSDLVNDERGWRIDLLAINLFDNRESEIRHYENI